MAKLLISASGWLLSHTMRCSRDKNRENDSKRRLQDASREFFRAPASKIFKEIRIQPCRARRNAGFFFGNGSGCRTKRVRAAAACLQSRQTAARRRKPEIVGRMGMERTRSYAGLTPVSINRQRPILRSGMDAACRQQQAEAEVPHGCRPLHDALADETVAAPTRRCASCRDRSGAAVSSRPAWRAFSAEASWR